MSWKQPWIDQVLEEIPAGRFRTRMEAELRDHLESEYQSRLDAGRTPQQAQEEALRVMGEPGKLKKEYKTAWRRSWPGRLRRLSDGADAWFNSLIIMAGAYFVAAFGFMFLSPVLEYFFDYTHSASSGYLLGPFPLCLSLFVGAVYLRPKFQTPFGPRWRISVPLFVHWLMATGIEVWWEAWWLAERLYDMHHRYPTLAERATFYWEKSGGQYVVTFVACILIGLVFGRIPMWKRETAAS